ncbi:MAG: flagellar hook-associated protein FlgK [Pseudomonadota bacterium]
MTISSALLSARTGLDAIGARADLVATNVANASTPGYVRRALTVSETILGGETAGVAITGVDRSENARLTAERRNLGSDFAQSEVLSATWSSLSQRIGDDIDGSTLFQRLSSLQTAMADAALSPESATTANQVVQSANDLVSEFQALSSLIAQERTRADQDIATGVDIVNAGLLEIQELNRSISSIDRSTAQAAALFDERDRVLDRISEYLPIQTFERDSGAIDVLTKEGVFLVAGPAQQISFTPANVVGPNQTLANGGLSGLMVGDTDITPGAGTFGAVSSGAFGALFTLRDSDLPALETQLDTMAQDLIDRFSDPAIDPTNPVGSPGLFLDTDPTAGTGIAGRLELNALVDPDRGGAVWRLRDGLGATVPGSPGDTTILTALNTAFDEARTISAPGLQGTYTATDLIAQIGALAGQQRIQNDAVRSSISLQYDTVKQAETNETAVDIEREMQDLLIIEQAYAANARVIQTASQMLNQLMEI